MQDEENGNSKNPLLDPESYNMIREIGRGTYSTVYLAKVMDKEVAVKIIKSECVNKEFTLIANEIALITNLKHPNIIDNYANFIKDGQIWIVTEYMGGNTCKDHLFSIMGDLEKIACVLKQTLSALNYLHKNNVIHRDIKSANLGLTKNGTVKLLDFGVSKMLLAKDLTKRKATTFTGTPCWMAPEVLEMKEYDSAADIWSVGILALELAYGHPPHIDLPAITILLKISREDPPSRKTYGRDSLSSYFDDFVSRCLNKKINKRWTAEKLLKHKFIKRYAKD